MCLLDRVVYCPKGFDDVHWLHEHLLLSTEDGSPVVGEGKK